MAKWKTDLSADLLPPAGSPLEGQRLLESRLEGFVLAGVDEVGRGPLAGPVVACVAVLDPGKTWPAGLNDSKKLTERKRQELFEPVQEACLCFAVAEASVEEIDRINVLAANFLAMRRALTALGVPGLEAPPGDVQVWCKGQLNSASFRLLVDGNLLITGIPPQWQIPIVKGDGRVACIAAASILAKVYRDRLMAELGGVYPGYGFEKHAGYGTAAHLQAIRTQGYTPVHRRSFKPKSLQGQTDLWN